MRKSGDFRSYLYYFKTMGNFRDNHLRLLNLRIYKKSVNLKINLWKFNKLRIFAALKQQSDN